ncbi:MAG: hypothetical protein H6Q14_2078 [Bacteroidetes bacterium]|nr:hypothetical protein [Bacteroidota bacterium]
MFYYRYRPYTEVNIKELLYNEIYFSSPEECNDPFDSKTFYVFEDNKEMWEKVITFSLKQTNAIVPDRLLHILANHISRKCPLTFDEAYKINLLTDFPTNNSNEKALVNFVGTRIQEILLIYRPATRYFVSFSKSNSEPLMWSHYADKHKGFCLVFRAINGALNQSLHQRKRSVVRTTKNGIAPNMTYGIPENFQFTKIDYEPEVKSLNAFLHLPVGVTGEKSEEEARKIRQEQESHYKQKSKSWEYETEYRLMLEPPLPSLFGEHFDYTKQERLFHYQPSQLVGIIYGAKMLEPEKNRIKELLKERRDWRVYHDNENIIEFSFIEYDAVLSSNQREVEIMPTGLLSYNTIPTSDPNFDRLYKEMLDGWGWERYQNGSGSRKMKVD